MWRRKQESCRQEPFITVCLSERQSFGESVARSVVAGDVE
jgi:hypothetical protein